MVQPSIAAYVNLRWRGGYQAVSNTPTRLAGILDAELSQYDQALPERVQLVVADLPQLGVLATLMARVWLEGEQRHGLFQHSLLFGGSPMDDEGVQAAFRAIYGAKPEQTIDALYNMASTLEYARGRPAFVRLLVSPQDLAAAAPGVPIVQGVLDELAQTWPALYAHMPTPEPAALQQARVTVPTPTPSGGLRAPVEALLAAVTPRMVLRAEGGLEREAPPVRAPARRPPRLRTDAARPSIAEAPPPKPPREVEAPTLPDLPKAEEPRPEPEELADLHPSQLRVEFIEHIPTLLLPEGDDDDRTEEYDPSRDGPALQDLFPPAPPAEGASDATPEAAPTDTPEAPPGATPEPPTGASRSRVGRVLAAAMIGLAFGGAVALGVRLGTTLRSSTAAPAPLPGPTAPLLAPAPAPEVPAPPPLQTFEPAPATPRARPRPTGTDRSHADPRGFTFAFSTASPCDSLDVGWTDARSGARVEGMGPLPVDRDGHGGCVLAGAATTCPLPAGLHEPVELLRPTQLEWLCCKPRSDGSRQCDPLAREGQ